MERFRKERRGVRRREAAAHRRAESRNWRGRNICEAKSAEQEVLHESRMRKTVDPAGRATMEQEYRRDRERFTSDRDAKIEKIERSDWTVSIGDGTDGAFVRQRYTIRDRITADGARDFRRCRAATTSTFRWPARGPTARSSSAGCLAWSRRYRCRSWIRSGTSGLGVPGRPGAQCGSGVGLPVSVRGVLAHGSVVHGRTRCRASGIASARRLAKTTTRTSRSTLKPRSSPTSAQALHLYPEHPAAEIDAINAVVYEDVNNGVYKAGFAASQAAYEAAVVPLFRRLDWLEDRLAAPADPVGDQLTEADIRLFPTLVRFDAVDHGHFKCNCGASSTIPTCGATRAICTASRVRRDGELRSHQASLLHDARSAEPDAHRAPRPDRGLAVAARADGNRRTQPLIPNPCDAQSESAPGRLRGQKSANLQVPRDPGKCLKPCTTTKKSALRLRGRSSADLQERGKA